MPRPVSAIPSLISRSSTYQPCSDSMMVSFTSGPLFLHDRGLDFSAWSCASLFNYPKSNISVLFQPVMECLCGLSLLIEYPALRLLQGSPLGVYIMCCLCLRFLLNFQHSSLVRTRTRPCGGLSGFPSDAAFALRTRLLGARAWLVNFFSKSKVPAGLGLD